MEDRGKIVAVSNPLSDGTVAVYLIKDAPTKELPGVRFEDNAEVQEYDPNSTRQIINEDIQETPGTQITPSSVSSDEESTSRKSDSSDSNKMSSGQSSASDPSSSSNSSSSDSSTAINNPPQTAVMDRSPKKSRTSTISRQNLKEAESALRHSFTDEEGDVHV